MRGINPYKDGVCLICKCPIEECEYYEENFRVFDPQEAKTMDEEKKRYTIKVESFVDRHNNAGEKYAGDHETVYEQTVESLNLQAVIAAVNDTSIRPYVRLNPDD